MTNGMTSRGKTKLPLTPDGVFEGRPTDAPAADANAESPPQVGAEVCSVEKENKNNSVMEGRRTEI